MLKRCALILFFVGTLTLAFAQQTPGDEAADLRRAANRVQQTIAHRGACAVRPENTLAAYRAAIESGATALEIDVRTTKDGVLVSLHDNKLDRTTDGTGAIGDITFKKLRKLDAGRWFDPRFAGERVPTLAQVLELCRGKIDVMMDLKESGDAFARQVAREVRASGEEKRMIVGVRSVDQAKRFRRLLPQARQIGLIPNEDAIESFARAGVETIRLWPRWLEVDPSLAERVRRARVGLHLGTTGGTTEEVVPLLAFGPSSLSSDDPGRLVKTLARLSETDAAETGATEPLTAAERKDIRENLAGELSRLNRQIKDDPKSVALYSSRGDVRFFRGEFREAVSDYEKMVELDPGQEKAHWRRGIAYFYAERYTDAARQFEIYHTFDDVDRENGIWRYLSQAKAYGLEKAREGLLKYKKDDREPFPDVYRMFAVKVSGDEIIKKIAAAKISTGDREKRLFYAHLYIGLNEFIENRERTALEHLRRAVANTWGPRAGFGPRYMWHVGRVHYELLKAKGPK